jgi:dTDP-4-dehydrorhamnose reductase
MTRQQPQLVVGASGLVGGALLETAGRRGIPAVGTYHRHAQPGLLQLDIRDAASVNRFVRSVRPGVVHLAAAVGSADLCEVDTAAAAAVNVEGVRNVARAAGSAGAHLVFFSSDYVFDGTAGPYSEDDPVAPICRYGELKVEAEQIVLDAGGLVVRTTVVYGWEEQGKNFVCRLLRTLAAGELLDAPVDQLGSPTYAPNLAEVTLELAARGERGVLHVVGPHRIDRYGFACAAARAFGLDESLIVPVETRMLEQIAPRPLGAGMRPDRAQALLQTRLIGYREGLALMAAQGAVVTELAA